SLGKPRLAKNSSAALPIRLLWYFTAALISDFCRSVNRDTIGHPLTSHNDRINVALKAASQAGYGVVSVGHGRRRAAFVVGWTETRNPFAAVVFRRVPSRKVVGQDFRDHPTISLSIRVALSACRVMNSSASSSVLQTRTSRLESVWTTTVTISQSPL